MLSLGQAERFLDSILRLPKWREVLERDKFQFLRLLVPYYTHHLYFHNVAMSAVPPEMRRPSTDEEIVQAGITGVGGTCLTLNGFLDMLLRELNFHSYLVSGFMHGPRNQRDNHVVCVVELSKTERYILDLGVGLPFPEPVPIHDLPYTQVAGGYRYKYAKGDKDTYYRIQLDGALFGGDFDDPAAEYIRYEFTLEPKTLDVFQKSLTLIYSNVERSPFLLCPFLFRYYEEDENGNLIDEPNTGSDRKWILIRGVSVLKGTNSLRGVTHYVTYDEVKHVMLKYFPKLRRDDVEKAIQNYKYGYGYV